MPLSFTQKFWSAHPNRIIIQMNEKGRLRLKDKHKTEWQE